MSGCLAITTFDGKPSKLHNNLVKIYGSDQAGLDKASVQYEFFKSNAFKEDVGFDWQTMELIDSNGVRTPSSSDEGIKQGYINDQLEPHISFINGMPIIKRTDGSNKFIDDQALRNFTETEIKEIVDFSIFVAMGKMQGISSLDFETNIEIDINGAYSPGSAFYDWGKNSLNFSDADFKELKRRAIENLRSKQLKLNDNDDYQKEAEENGNEEGEEVKENRTSNDVVKVESFSINSKNSATANIKMMLSFIPEMKSYTENEDGSYTPVLQEGTYTPVKFKDMDKIWRKIEDNISNIFTKEVGGEVESVLSQMMTKLYELGQEDPTIMYIYSLLNGERMDDYKKTQFAQAFLKQKLLFYTSEVEGEGESINYKFFDAGTSTSKESKLRNFWEIGASTSPYYKKDVEAEKVNYKLDSSQVQKDLKSIDNILTSLRDLVKGKVTTLNETQKDTLNKILERLGIPVATLHDKTVEKVLRKLYADSGRQVYNEASAVGILLNTYVKPALDVLSKTTTMEINSKDGDFKNPLKANKFTRLFSDEEAKMTDDTSENTLMGAGNKMIWGFALPTYLDITVNKFKKGFIQDENGNWYNPFIDQLRSLSGNKNSKWLEWLSVRENANQFFAITFNSFQKRNSDNDAVDNKEIRFFDQLSDQINKYLNGIKDNEQSIYYSPTPADKGRLISFKGPAMAQTTFKVSSKGNVTVSENSKTVDQIADYFEDEYTRMQETWNTVTSLDPANITEKLYVHYHLVKGKYVDEKGVPVGNGFKSQLFPELSATYKTSATPTEIELEADKIRPKLYDAANKMKPIGITAETRKELNKFIAKVISLRIRELSTQFVKDGIFEVDKKTNTVKNKSIDSRVWKKYSDNAVNKKVKESTPEQRSAHSYEVALKIVGDYIVNGIISNTEYSKVFSGDPAYYKDPVDYNKRVPATYTDGKYLVGIDKKTELHFNVGVTTAIEISARNLFKNKENPDNTSMEENFILSLSERAKYIDEKIRPTQEEIEAQANALTQQYTNVNAADAQGWITLERWKFLKTKLDGWSPTLDAAYNRMLDGTFSYADIKLAAQPLKGVYFNRDVKTGVPTYLKYSQMVLIPGMWKGTSLENLTQAMQEQKLDEVITVDGVKSGALNPVKIHNEDGSLIEAKDMKFNSYQLSNLHWKLQQQLPVKTMKEDMDLGSQLQKNIISNIIPDAVYGKLDGVDLTGADILKLINESVYQLTDLSFKEITNKIGTDEEGNIKHKAKLYRELAKQLESKNMPSFIVEAIKRGYSLDAIPQVRYKAQNVISAMINNNVAKTITPGGSMIQMSNVGVTKIQIKNTDPKNGGIYMLKDVKSLHRPELYVNAEGKTSVFSGQVFIPHSFIVKYIPDYQSLSREDLFKRLDKRLLNIIGYRIPNQKMSSIQPLEIVGILPPAMGDAIMMYSEITTQTGSDFDIDKTYIMLPEFYADKDKDTGKYSLHYVNSKPNAEDKQGKKQLRNQLFELYNILLKSPLNYADMASGIDGSYLKDLIKTTHKKKEAAKKMTSLKMADPYYQLGIKFANSAGKSGVGLTANQLVDHPLTQIYNSILTKSYDSTIKPNIGLGNIKDKTYQDFSQMYDTAGYTITDTVSMFLNAFVDIAKDPYITDGNFNDVTSNIVFFMIRGGVPLDFVVKFIGQPAFEEVVKTVLDSQSIIQEERTLGIKDAIEQIKGEYNSLILEMIKDSPALQEARITLQSKYNKPSKINKDDLQRMIDNPNKQDLEYLVSQVSLLSYLDHINQLSQPLTELVLASKADVNGGGPDIAGHITGLSRFNKVIDEGFFSGVEERFAPNTMLGSKTQRTLEYLNKLDEQLFISANEGFKSIYTYLSLMRRGSEYILDKEFVQSIEKEVYAYAMNEIMKLTDKYTITQSDLSTMFKTEGNKRSIADRVLRLKQQEDLKDNALIQNLEIKEVKGFKFVSLDNFKNKPSSSLDLIQRGWRDLFENEAYIDFATDLVKYAYSTSGFARNRNSIYEVIPLNVSDDINRKIQQYKDENSLMNFTPENFLNTFFRSPNGEQWTSKVSTRNLAKLKPLTSIKAISAIDPAIGQKLKDLKLKDNSVIFVSDRASDEEEAKILMRATGNKLVSFTSKDSFSGAVTSNLYENQGTFHLGEETYFMLTKTYKLGLNTPGLKIFEPSVSDRSFIPSNNPANYDNIVEFVQWLQDETLNSEYSYPAIQGVHKTKNAIRPSLEAVENLTRRDIIQKKCD